MIHLCEDGIVYNFIFSPESPVKGRASFDCFDGHYDYPVITINLSKNRDVEDLMLTIVHEQLHHAGVWLVDPLYLINKGGEAK